MGKSTRLVSRKKGSQIELGGRGGGQRGPDICGVKGERISGGGEKKMQGKGVRGADEQGDLLGEVGELSNSWRKETLSWCKEGGGRDQNLG